MRNILLVMISLFLLSCGSAYNSSISDTPITICNAKYFLSLSKVERPEKASQRYGSQKIDTASMNKYKFYFEDDLVKVLWSVSSDEIAFTVQNKTDHSIKIPWDDAAFIDENGSSHRVMHSGIKYNDRQQAQAPSIVVRKASLEDIVFPTDYVSWEEGGRYTSGKWKQRSFYPDYDYQNIYRSHEFNSFEEFDKAVKSKVGKTFQVLLPLQIEDVINDYIFSFKVDSVFTSKR